MHRRGHGKGCRVPGAWPSGMIPILLVAALVCLGAPGGRADDGAPVTGRQAYARSGRAVNLARLKGWAIVVAPDALPAERYAAEELQRLLLAVGAPELPLVDTARQRRRHFFVGPGDALHAQFPEFADAAFADEECRIVAVGQSVVITGGRPRGTLYGVYVFAEDYSRGTIPDP